MSVGIQYIESWLRGVGAAAINNLMEDVATAEISRSQVWQWIRHSSRLSEGSPVTADLVREIADDELAKVRERLGEELWAKGPVCRGAAGVRGGGAVGVVPGLPDPGGPAGHRLIRLLTGRVVALAISH